MSQERAAYEVALLAHMLLRPDVLDSFTPPRLSPEAQELLDVIVEGWAAAQCAGLETWFTACRHPASVATRCDPDRALRLAALVDATPVAQVAALGSINVVMHELEATSLRRIAPHQRGAAA